jgi:hypothetical protein
MSRCCVYLPDCIAARYITRMTGEVSRLEKAIAYQEAQQRTELASMELYLQL